MIGPVAQAAAFANVGGEAKLPVVAVPAVEPALYVISQLTANAPMTN